MTLWKLLLCTYGPEKQVIPLNPQHIVLKSAKTGSVSSVHLQCPETHFLISDDISPFIQQLLFKIVFLAIPNDFENVSASLRQSSNILMGNYSKNKKILLFACLDVVALLMHHFLIDAELLS